MNRRRFLELLSMAAVGGAIAYAFPPVIVPQNLMSCGHPLWTQDRGFHIPCGLSYVVNDGSKVFQGLYTNRFPVLTSRVVEGDTVLLVDKKGKGEG